MSNQKTKDGSSEDLCQSCGLCCDGTLFDVVPLKPQDLPEPLRLVGIRVVVDDTPGRFTQPCAAHQHGCCQVYASRPSSCREYECELLKKFARGAVTFASAETQIALLRGQRDRLATEVERLRPGTGRLSVLEIHKLLPPGEALTKDIALHEQWAPVVTRLFALRRLVYERFKPPLKHDAAVETPENRAPAQ